MSQSQSSHTMDEFSQEASQLNVSEGDMSEDDTPNTPFDPRDIATLLSNYYQLMARMRYFSPDCIKYPPHDPPIDVEFAKSLDLEPQVIELLQVLPYVEGLNNEDEFILSGSFADMRQKSVLEQSRDPDYVDPTGGYDEENGKYVMPWMLVLNECGNHGSIMYFNTRNSDKITMVWQGGAGGGCADPYFWGKHSSGDEDPHEINDNRIEQFPSRPATDLFADFTNRLMTLEWIPFNTYGPRIVDEHSKDEYPDLKLLFETYGWPGELDAEGFDAASRRWKEFNRVRSDAQDMLTKADLYGKEAERLRKRLEETLEKKRDGVWDEDIAKTPEDVAKMEEHVKRWQQNLEWEEKLRDEAAEEAEGVHDWDSALEKSWKTNISGDIRYHKKNLDWYRGGGAQYATEDKIQELEVGIAELEERLQDIDALPKTAFDAIKPQLDRQWLSAR